MRTRFLLAVCLASLLSSACKRAEPPKSAPASGSSTPDATGAGTTASAAGFQEKAGSTTGQSTLLAALPEEPPTAPSPGGSTRQFVFGERGGGVAWVEREGSSVRVLHNGRAGPPYRAVESLVVSADGARWAYAAQVDGKWRMVVDGRESEPFDAVEAPVFSPDGAHFAYRARLGEGVHLVVDGKATAGTRGYLMHAFGAGSRLVFIDEADEQGLGRLVVSDLAFETQTVVAPRVAGVILNGDGSRLGTVAVGADGQRVVSVALDRSDRLTRGPVKDRIAYLSFAPDGVSLAYVADKGNKRSIVLGDREEPVSRTDVIVTVPVVRPDGRGVGVAVVSGGVVALREYFVKGGATDGTYGGIDDLVYSSDRHSRAYVAEKDGKFFVVANGKKGPAFDRVVTPRFSPDGKLLVYRARQDGKRFVVVADTEGKTLRQHPAYEQVFPVQFTPDGRSVAYGVKDGRQLAWKVEPL